MMPAFLGCRDQQSLGRDIILVCLQNKGISDRTHQIRGGCWNYVIVLISTLPLFETNLTERPEHNTEYSWKYEFYKCYCFSELFMILLLTAPLNYVLNTVLTLLDR